MTNGKMEIAHIKPKIYFKRVKDLPGLELYRGIDVNRLVPRHLHWVFSLSVADTGVRIHETKLGKYLITPGSILVVNLGEAHSGSVPEGYHYSSRSIRIDPMMLSTLLMNVTERQCDSIHFKEPVIHDPDLFRQIVDLHTALGEPASNLEKEYLLLDIFKKLHAHSWRKNIKLIAIGDERTPVSRVCEYLQDCFNENVSLDTLAEIAGISPFHLSRVFAKEMGVPPHTYQLQVRLKKATDLLSLGKPIAEVALETGFCDQSHFQKAFKKKFGITPGQYK